jgi:hypothetical protein
MSNVTNIKKQKYTAEETLAEVKRVGELFEGIESIVVLAKVNEGGILARGTSGDDWEEWDKIVKAALPKKTETLGSKEKLVFDERKGGEEIIFEDNDND